MMTDETKQLERRDYFMGVVMLIAAGVLWSVSGALIKPIYDNGKGMSAVAIAFYRSLFAGLALLPFALGKFHTLCPNTATTAEASNKPAPAPGAFSLLRIRPAALSCVVFFSIMTLCFVVAVTKTEAANAIILQYTSTFWIFALSPMLLREKPESKDFALLVMALIGIAVIFVGQASTDLAGLTIALCAGLFFGLETLMIRRLRDADSFAVTVLNLLGSAILIFPFVLFEGHGTAAPSDWILLATLGCLQFGLPYYLFARALKNVPAHDAALITLIEPLLVPVWTYLAVGEIVTGTTVVGGGIILLTLVVLLGRTHYSSRQKGFAPAIANTTDN